MKTGLRIFNDSLRFDTTGNYDAELIAALKAQGFRYVKYGWETDYEEGHFWFKDTESDKDRIFALKEALKRNMIIGIQHGLGTHIEKLKTENSLKAIISERYLKSCIAGHLNFDECGLSPTSAPASSSAAGTSGCTSGGHYAPADPSACSCL
jgi:hypothetical protein